MGKVIILLVCVFMHTLVGGQVSGNQVFSNKNNHGSYNYYGESGNTSKSHQITKLSLSDSAYIIQAKVLKNIKADYYIAVFGIINYAKTVSESNKKVNKRTKSFIENIKKIGIKESNIYTDIITQYRVYDFEKNDNHEIEEHLKGYELSKNIIIMYNDAGQIEQLLTLASKDSIYDLIKVDYIVNDVSKVYEDLFKAAAEVIKKKKELYASLTSNSEPTTAQIYGENFVSYYPIEMYKSYNAFSTNFYESDWRIGDRTKAQRKFTTFYYDKTQYSGFDKIINPTVLEPAVQFVFTLQVKYNLKK